MLRLRSSYLAVPRARAANLPRSPAHPITARLEREPAVRFPVLIGRYAKLLSPRHLSGNEPVSRPAQIPVFAVSDRIVEVARIEARRGKSTAVQPQRESRRGAERRAACS